MRIFGLTDVGRLRTDNQDTWLSEEIGENRAVFVVCDGMGGALAGNVASGLAAEVFLKHLRDYIRPEMSEKYARSILLNAVNFANYEVYRSASENPSYAGMGTTLVGGFLQHGTAMLANVGDSRAYHVDPQKISRVTRDHSVIEELIERGNITPEQARRHPHRHLITRALGTEERVRADFYPLTLAQDEMLLLCSDGLSGMLEDSALFDTCHTYGEPEECARRLVDAANNAGGHDNVTVLLLRA